ncbi:prefoldin subunit 5 [Cornus florida]|uniref:prefoldin subunit 5 n=1 Tax=Cornus florida TaxID=4283 RepID=UPI0028A1BB52|nr:prefoldin subunit 5 [Cornus florida]
MASKGGGGAGTIGRIPEIEKMGVDQLKALKEQADLEVNLLQDSLNNIRTATVRLEIASNALQDLSLRPQGKKMLVPLTASLYAPGTLDDADKVLVDVGTGYFIEKTMAEGKDYCERKINLLKSNYDQLVEVATKKKSIADQVGVILQSKLKQLAPTP